MPKRKRRPRDIIGTIGWREWVALPDLGVHLVKAKIDTGARSSALHAFDVEVRRQGRGSQVHFSVRPLQRDDRTVVRCSAALADERWVTSSNGKREMRPVIQTSLQLLDMTWTIELTLTSRDEMGFRMLLGREAIRGRFLVDPSRSFLAQKKHPKKTTEKRGTS
jgi:hypothetical protein